MFVDINEYLINQNGKIKRSESILTQPGLRFAQILAAIDTIIENPNVYTDDLANKIYSYCSEDLFEECIRLNVANNLCSNTVDVFKIRLTTADKNGEFDLAIFDEEKKEIQLFEIKRGEKNKKNGQKILKIIFF